MQSGALRSPRNPRNDGYPRCDRIHVQQAVRPSSPQVLSRERFTMVEPTLKEKVDLLKLLIDTGEKESDRSWTRYSVMLYANTGLVAIVSLAATIKAPAIAILPSVLGLWCSIVWFRMGRLSYYYTHRWHADVMSLVASDEFLSEYVRARNNPRIDRPGSRFVRWSTVPVSFSITWTAAIAISIALTFAL